jgi:uncharacterized protein
MNKKLTIRFYEELNDFLLSQRRKKRFTYNYTDSTSVKDLIESMGVPHTEVDLILVNGVSVNFEYMIKDGDDISVYPTFESFDISPLQHLRPMPLRDPKFILDVHLGTLARYLRMIGIDSYYKNNLTDDQIIEISLNERRGILTRDRGMLKRKVVTHGYYVRATDPVQQLNEVVNRFQLKGMIDEFTRCMECNTPLIEIAKEEVFENIPEKVRKYQERFKKCNGCGKIYWRGSHYIKMEKIISQLKK